MDSYTGEAPLFIREAEKVSFPRAVSLCSRVRSDGNWDANHHRSDQTLPVVTAKYEKSSARKLQLRCFRLVVKICRESCDILRM